jgi:phage host-nuclease inhibitor protein Gam
MADPTPPLPGIGPVSTPEQAVCLPDSGASPGDDDLAPEGHHGPWIPQTVRDVEWALARIAEAEAEAFQIRQSAQAALDAIARRRDDLIAKSQRRAGYLTSLVATWAREHRGEVVRGKIKTRDFLSGSVGFRAAREKITITDEATFLTWAQPDHLDLVRAKIAPDKKALDAFVTRTGEIPPGVDVEPASETIVIKAEALPGIDAVKAAKEIE